MLSAVFIFGMTSFFFNIPINSRMCYFLNKKTESEREVNTHGHTAGQWGRLRTQASQAETSPITPAPTCHL